MTLKKENVVTGLWFGLGFLVIAGFMLLFHMEINAELEATEIENLRLTANQQQVTLNGAIDAQATNLQSMSKTLGIIRHNPIAVAEYLNNIEKNLNIDTVIMTDDNGMGTLSNLTQVDVMDNEAFQSAMHGVVWVTKPVKSVITGKDVI